MFSATNSRPAPASSVVVTGDFDQWLGTLHLHKGKHGFERSVAFDDPRRLVFKFIVDGVWVTSSAYATETDASGNVNNVVEADALEIGGVGSFETRVVTATKGPGVTGDKGAVGPDFSTGSRPSEGALGIDIAETHAEPPKVAESRKTEPATKGIESLGKQANSREEMAKGSGKTATSSQDSTTLKGSGKSLVEAPAESSHTAHSHEPPVSETQGVSAKAPESTSEPHPSAATRGPSQPQNAHLSFSLKIPESAPESTPLEPQLPGSMPMDPSEPGQDYLRAVAPAAAWITASVKRDRIESPPAEEKTSSASSLYCLALSEQDADEPGRPYGLFARLRGLFK